MRDPRAKWWALAQWRRGVLGHLEAADGGTHVHPSFCWTRSATRSRAAYPTNVSSLSQGTTPSSAWPA